MPRHSDVDAALQAIYDQIPKISACTGECWISCAAIDMTSRERQRIRQAGYDISYPEDVLGIAETFYCEALTADHRCAVYELRPVVCRLWGATRAMPCPYGCVPDGGFLTDETAARLSAEAAAIGGTRISLTPAEVMEGLSDPMKVRLWRDMMEGVTRQGMANRELDVIPDAFRKDGGR